MISWCLFYFRQYIIGGFMDIEDGYYACGEPEYIGCMPIRRDIEVLHDKDMPPVKGWFVKECVSVNGNKYIKLLAKYLKKVGKTSEDELSAEEIEKLYSKCTICKYK
jgi:hypothetical protein